MTQYIIWCFRAWKYKKVGKHYKQTTGSYGLKLHTIIRTKFRISNRETIKHYLSLKRQWLLSCFELRRWLIFRAKHDSLNLNTIFLSHFKSNLAWQAMFDVRLIWLFCSFSYKIRSYIIVYEFIISIFHLQNIENEIVVSIKNSRYKKEVF